MRLGRALTVASILLACSPWICATGAGCAPRSSDSSDGADAAAPAPPDGSLALPDPLVFTDGRRVASKEEWPARRAEIVDLFREHVYGRAPGRPETLAFTVLEEDPNAMGGRATLRRVAVKSVQAGREHTFELVRFSPNIGRRAGVFLLLNHRPPDNTDPTRAKKTSFWPAEEIIARGYGVAAIRLDQVAPDDSATYASGVLRLFEGDNPPARPANAWKTIGAWSWAASRAMDYFETDPLVDAARVAVIGHSRAGKAALWAGAQDERFSLTISNNSGCAGAALSRRPVGETVAGVNLIFPHWFADNFRRYGDNEAALPVDQHMLVALMAPRAVAVASASKDEWADPEGEYLGLAYSSSVYALWGLSPVDPKGMPAVGSSIFVAPRGYHLREGEHALTEWDWQRYADVADRVWAR